MKVRSTNAMMFAALLWFEGQASALPFRIDLGAFGRHPGSVEIQGSDGRVLDKKPTGSERHVTLNFPADGLYTLTVRKAETVLWKESIYVVIKRPTQDLILRASWENQPQLMRTVLRLQEPDGAQRFGVSIRDKLYLRLRTTPRLIRVMHEDYSGVPVAAQQLLVQAVTEKEALEQSGQTSSDIQFDIGKGDDDQIGFEPDYKALLAGKEDETWREKVLALGANRKKEPLGRKHRISGWVRLMQEEFQVKRGRDTYTGEKSQGFGMGFAANAVFRDTMTLQLEVDTHGTKTQYESGGSNPPAEQQKRVHARFGPLLDILNVEHAYPDQAIELGPVIGYTTTPIEDDDQGKVDFGGSLRWRTIGPSAAEFQLRFMKSHSYDASLVWTGEESFYSVSPLFGLYLYHTKQSSGEASSKFDEFGVRFGLQKSF